MELNMLKSRTRQEAILEILDMGLYPKAVEDQPETCVKQSTDACDWTGQRVRAWRDPRSSKGRRVEG
jgi:hypothetical protein